MLQCSADLTGHDCMELYNKQAILTHLHDVKATQVQEEADCNYPGQVCRHWLWFICLFVCCSYLCVYTSVDTAGS